MEVELKFPQLPHLFHRGWDNSEAFCTLQSSPRSLTTVSHSAILFNYHTFFFGGHGSSYNFFVSLYNSLFYVSWNHIANKLCPLITSIYSYNYDSVVSFISNIHIITLSNRIDYIILGPQCKMQTQRKSVLKGTKI